MKEKIKRILKNKNFQIFRKYYSKFLCKRLPITVTIQGSKIIRAPVWLYKAKIHEAPTTKLCKKIIKTGWTVIDLGAEYGYYTLLFAKLVGPTGLVYSFEPDRKHYLDLIRNIKINHLTNVISVNKAVTDKSGIENFFTGDHSFYKIDGRKGAWIKVDTIRLDDFFKNYSGEIHFIKMDIEGAESKALCGMVNIFKKFHNLKMVMEFSLKVIDKAGLSPKKLLNQLRSYGFYLYKIQNDGTIIRSSNKEIINDVKARGYPNIFCSR